MNNVSLSNKVIYWNPKDFAVSQNFNKVIRENEKISNDYYWKSNKSEGADCFGRTLDLTTLINKPDGYLQGRLSDVDDADYYQFNIAEYRILGIVSDKRNLDITVTLDHIPEGCDYDLVLYDGDGNQVGIGRDNGNGGKSVTVPNWNLENREYTVKVLAKDGSPVNAEEYYHLSFQTKQAANDNVLRQQAKEMQEYAYALRKKLHDGSDATEEKLALQQIREKYGAYYTQQMDELHNKQAAEYLAEGEVFDESRKEELLSRMAAGGELTEQSGVSPIPSFEVSIGIDGKAEVKGIEDAAVKEKVEDILNGFSGELMDTYISINASMQGMTKQEQYILKAAMGIEAFLQKATGGNVALSDTTVENGRIKGLAAPLDRLLNDPGKNQTYLDYRADIFAIKNYEKMNGNSLLGGFSARYAVDGETIRTIGI